jgi:hypothetical protein
MSFGSFGLMAKSWNWSVASPSLIASICLGVEDRKRSQSARSPAARLTRGPARQLTGNVARRRSVRRAGIRAQPVP